MLASACCLLPAAYCSLSWSTRILMGAGSAPVLRIALAVATRAIAQKAANTAMLMIVSFIFYSSYERLLLIISAWLSKPIEHHPCRTDALRCVSTVFVTVPSPYPVLVPCRKDRSLDCLLAGTVAATPL